MSKPLYKIVAHPDLKVVTPGAKVRYLAATQQAYLANRTDTFRWLMYPNKQTQRMHGDKIVRGPAQGFWDLTWKEKEGSYVLVCAGQELAQDAGPGGSIQPEGDGQGHQGKDRGPQGPGQGTRPHRASEDRGAHQRWQAKEQGAHQAAQDANPRREEADGALRPTALQGQGCHEGGTVCSASWNGVLLSRQVLWGKARHHDRDQRAKRWPPCSKGAKVIASPQGSRPLPHDVRALRPQEEPRHATKRIARVAELSRLRRYQEEARPRAT